jgi:hypothetical protein
LGLFDFTCFLFFSLVMFAALAVGLSTC